MNELINPWAKIKKCNLDSAIEQNSLEIWHDVMTDTGQPLLIRIKIEQKSRVLLSTGHWPSTTVTEAEAIWTTMAAFAVSRTLCSTRSGLISDYLTTERSDAPQGGVWLFVYFPLKRTENFVVSSCQSPVSHGITERAIV